MSNQTNVSILYSAAGSTQRTHHAPRLLHANPLYLLLVTLYTRLLRTLLLAPRQVPHLLLHLSLDPLRLSARLLPFSGVLSVGKERRTAIFSNDKLILFPLNPTDPSRRLSNGSCIPIHLHNTISRRLFMLTLCIICLGAGGVVVVRYGKGKRYLSYPSIA